MQDEIVDIGCIIIIIFDREKGLIDVVPLVFQDTHHTMPLSLGLEPLRGHKRQFGEEVYMGWQDNLQSLLHRTMTAFPPESNKLPLGRLGR